MNLIRIIIIFGPYVNGCAIIQRVNGIFIVEGWINNNVETLLNIMFNAKGYFNIPDLIYVSSDLVKGIKD